MKNAAKKIYTRRGDQGLTQLLSGESVRKDDPRVEAYGVLDELQCHLGMARSLVKQDSVRTVLRVVQESIFSASSELASTPEMLHRFKNHIDTRDVQRLESWIDDFEKSHGLPDRFLVPGRSIESAALHIARAVCRRGERLIARLNRETGVYENLLVFFNRLSDLIFILAWAVELEDVIIDVLGSLSGRSSIEG